MNNMRSIRITPHNGESAFNYPVVVDMTASRALISADLAFWLLDAKMIRSSGRVSQVSNGNKSGEVTFDAQYEGNYVTVTAQIDTTPGGLLKLGKRDLWELGLDTTAGIAARALRVNDTKVAPIKEEEHDYSP